MMVITQLSGQQAETFAERHLKSQGLSPVTKNFHSRFGEIDLIMRHQQVLVFIEVRLRNNASYGSGADSIDNRKQTKIIKTANYYLQQQQLLDTCPCRFDIVSLSKPFSAENTQWITDAFQAF